MLAPSSLTMPAIVPELDASWHCTSPRSYSSFAMHTRSIYWSRTSSPQLANYGLSGARHYLDIEQVDCEVVALFARCHEGDVWVQFGSCPNGRHVMELSSKDVNVVATSEIGLQDVHPALELTR